MIFGQGSPTHPLWAGHCPANTCNPNPLTAGPDLCMNEFGKLLNWWIEFNTMDLYLFPGFYSPFCVCDCFGFQCSVESRLGKGRKLCQSAGGLVECMHPPSFQVWGIALFRRSLIWVVLILDVVTMKNMVTIVVFSKCWWTQIWLVTICAIFLYRTFCKMMMIVVTHFVGAVVLYVKAQGVTSRKRI